MSTLNESLSTLTLEVRPTYTPMVLDGHRAPGLSDGFGFEGGRVVRVGEEYRLFSTEILSDPVWVHTALAQWSSPDGIIWERVGTVFQSTGDHTGSDPFAALFSPMAVFNDELDVWEMFFVAYRSEPDRDGAFLQNHSGRVLHARSIRAGEGGVDAPFRVLGVALEPGPESQDWEGLQGTDSFFPFRRPGADGWLAFYGSATTEHKGSGGLTWRVGLAQAPALEGPWIRRGEGNPSPVEPTFIENPVVSRTANGLLIGLYDNGGLSDAGLRSFGAMASEDGVNWARLPAVSVPDETANWAVQIRTPLGLVPLNDGGYRIHFTGFSERGSGHPTGHVGYVDVDLRNSLSVTRNLD